MVLDAVKQGEVLAGNSTIGKSVANNTQANVANTPYMQGSIHDANKDNYFDRYVKDNADKNNKEAILNGLATTSGDGSKVNGEAYSARTNVKEGEFYNQYLIKSASIFNLGKQPSAELAQGAVIAFRGNGGKINADGTNTKEKYNPMDPYSDAAAEGYETTV